MLECSVLPTTDDASYRSRPSLHRSTNGDSPFINAEMGYRTYGAILIPHNESLLLHSSHPTSSIKSSLEDYLEVRHFREQHMASEPVVPKTPYHHDIEAHQGGERSGPLPRILRPEVCEIRRSRNIRPSKGYQG